MVRMRRRAGAFLLALAVSLGSAVAGASPARADALTSPWLPTSWIMTAVGNIASARTVLAGDTSGYVAAPAGMELGDWAVVSPHWYYGWTKWEPVFGGWDATGKSPILTLKFVGGSGDYANWGTCPQWGCDGTPVSRDRVVIDCADGQSSFGTEFGGGVYSPTRLGCVPTRFHWEDPGGAQVLRNFSIAVGNATSETFTTELTCRSLATGTDQVVSETRAGSAPAPVCPAGSYAIRTKVSSSKQGVLQDASINVPNGAQDYLVNPGDWQWQVWVDGLPCIAGSAACDAWTSIGTWPPNGDCVIIDNGGPSTFSVSLPKTDCEDWRVGGGTFINEPGSDGTGDNAIKVAVDRVVQAVKQWGKSISDGIGRLGQLIGDGIGGIRDKLTSLMECPAGSGCKVSTGGGGDGVMDGIGDELGQKFQPWIDAWQDMIGGFDAGSPGCAGPSWSVGKPLYITVHPFDACSQPMAGVASVFKAALSVVVSVAGLMGCTRVLLASIGLQIGKGSTEDGA